MFRTITVFIMLIVLQPYMLIPMFFAVIIMRWIFTRNIYVTNACQKLDSVYRGPLSTNFTNVVSGLVTLRTFDRLPYFENIFVDDLDKSCNVTFSMFCLQRQMTVQLDFVCVCVMVSSAAFTLFSKGPDADNKQLAFSLQILTDVVVFFSVCIRFIGMIENFMTSAQRLMDYTDLEKEDKILKDGDKKWIKEEWPQKGQIEFMNASMRYRETLEPSIKQLTFTVQPNMKVGIVGRTGAGKSSIL